MRVLYYAAVLALVSSLPASAQAIAGARSPGIAVAGRATVRVPADGVRFEAGVSGALSDADEDAILDALRAGGVDSPQIVDPNFVSANSPTTVRGSIRHPSRDRVLELGKLAASLLAAHPTLRLVSTYVAPFVDDCAKVEDEARRQALDDARRRAASIAAIEGVKLGAVSNVSELSDRNCGPDYGRLAGQAPGNGIEREPAVYITMTEDVTYSIAPTGP
jgi:uncharacterized protein YggE